MRYKKIAVLSLIAAFIMGLSGCGIAHTKSNSDQAGKAPALIAVNNTEPASYLLPSNTGDTAGWKIVTQLFEGLVTFGRKGELIYADAESITPNQDASIYTIKLKQGLKFTNGEAVTARSYARAWSFAANAANGQLGAALFSTIAGYDQLQDKSAAKNAQFSGITIIDDYTLRVQLKAPDSSFPYKVGDVAFMPLPTIAYTDPASFGKHPIGNGPYMFKEWIPNQSISLVKNHDYTGPRKAKNEGLLFRNYESLDAAYTDVEAGNLDVLDKVPVSSLATYRDDSTVKAYSQPGPSLKTLTIPSALPHFQGHEGILRRQAISKIIDRVDIVSKVLRNSVTVATDFTAPTIVGYSRSLQGEQSLEYNRDQARKLWEEANTISPWTGTFEIAYNADGSDKDWVDAVIHAVQANLGIPAQSNIFPTSKEFKTAINQRQLHAAYSSGIQSDYPHPEGYLVQAYASWFADGKGLNNGDYKSAEFDALIQQAAQQNQLDTAIPFYQQAQELLLHDLPSVPLWYENVTAVASKQMQTVEFSYMGLPSYYELKK